MIPGSLARQPEFSAILRPLLSNSLRLLEIRGPQNPYRYAWQHALQPRLRSVMHVETAHPHSLQILHGAKVRQPLLSGERERREAGNIGIGTLGPGLYHNLGLAGRDDPARPAREAADVIAVPVRRDYRVQLPIAALR